MRTAAVLVLLLAGCHYPPPTDPCQGPPTNPGVRPADTGVVVGKVKVVCVDGAS